jgi:hypothetical protein
MTNKKDIELINEYEELLVLLRQLHKDTPILEKQHHSINKAFVDAQKKLETTIASANEEIEIIKKNILADFEVDCRKIIGDLISEAQSQTALTLKKLQAERKSLELLLSKVENIETKIESFGERLEQQIEDTQKQPGKRKKSELIDGEIYTGEELIKRLSSHINKDLFVKRIIAKSGKPWKSDYCMLITGYDDTEIRGETYKDGTIYEEHKEYPLYDSFMIYRGPSEQKIIDSRQ